MSFLVSNCTFCNSNKIRFDNLGFNKIDETTWHCFLVCSHCNKPTVFRLARRHDANYTLRSILNECNELKQIKNINLLDGFVLIGKIIPPNDSLRACPNHVPEKIKIAFDEASICYSNACYIACASMLRLCLDITTKELLQEFITSNTDENQKPKNAEMDKLYNRINFLIDKFLIPSDLRDFAHQIRLDGNDAAHDGSTAQVEAEDLMDFSILLLERIFTNKAQLKLAQDRRVARRSS